MAKKKSASSRGSQADASFETSLTDVEQIVTRLEAGELGLTESLQQYELGIRQLKRCHALLDAAQQRVSVLSGFDEDGNPVTEPLADVEASENRGEKRVRRKRRPKSTSNPKEGGNDAVSELDAANDSVDDAPGLF